MELDEHRELPNFKKNIRWSLNILTKGKSEKNWKFLKNFHSITNAVHS